MIDVEKLFFNDSNVFTVYVVEQRFAIGQGHEYFSQYLNTPNFLESEGKAKKFYKKILEKIEKKDIFKRQKKIFQEMCMFQMI